MRLWFGIFIGPMAWAADSGLSYGLTQWACAVDSSPLLLVLSALAFGAALAGLFAALRAYRELRSSPGIASTADPSRFLAISGVVLSSASLLLIIAAAIPRLFVNLCI
jgi:hypothetical protein